MLVRTDDVETETRVPAAAEPRPAGRIATIDFIKGALVVFMVVYHSLNYSAWRAMPGLYMAFLPPSFILITGFLVTNVYTGKYHAGSWSLYRRLLVRGMKLIVIFTVLNLSANALFTENYNGQKLGVTSFFSEWQNIFLFGSGRKPAFEILLPIGYLLLASPVLLALYFANTRLVPLLAGVAFVALTWMEQAGLVLRIEDMFSVGVIGMAAGQVPLAKWEGIARNWFYVLVPYALYWLAWGLLGQIYPAQVFAACVSVLLLYAIGIRLKPGAFLVAEINRLGRYSLFSYIAQIAVLQALHRLAFRGTSFLSAFWLTVLTLVLTWGAVRFVEVFRRKSQLLDGLYRTTFG
jgi:hypothetical protein